MQQTQYAKNNRSEDTKNLIEGIPVKEEEKLRISFVTRQNTSALDMMGLTWVFEDDCS